MASLFNMPKLMPLYPRQQAGIDTIRQCILEGHTRIVGQGATGFGKTQVAAHIIASALKKGKRPLFTVPRLSLIPQTIARFEAQGIQDIGVIQGRHERTDGNAAIQIASVQTLVRRPIPDIDLVLADECHIQMKAFHELMDGEAWKDKIVIGLSATPWAKGMGLRYTALVPFGTTREGIDEGWLTPLRIFSVPDELLPNRKGIRTNFDGDYVEGDAERAMTTPAIIGNVVKTWMEKWGKDKTFMFCVNRAHAKRMQEKFEQAGISCGYIDGTMDGDEREVIMDKYRTSEYRVLSSIDTIGIGVDEDVRCIVYLRLTKSDMKLVQDVGRGLRLADDKNECILLDHAGVCEELGDPTYIHHDHLDMRDPNERGAAYVEDPKPAKPFKCPHCNAIIPRRMELCPVCTYAMPKDRRIPRHIQGELVEMTGGKRKQKMTAAEQEESRTKWYRGLLHIAHERGYKDGWAAHKYKLKFGNWPNGIEKIAEPPSKGVAAWAKNAGYEAKRTEDAAP